MVRATLLIAFLGCFFSSAFSQSVIWRKMNSWSYEHYAGGIGFDASGNSYVTGYYVENYQMPRHRGIFITKYNSAGAWVWSDTINASSPSGWYDIKCNASATDSNGSTYVTGYLNGVAAFGSTTISSPGTPALFFAKYDASGNCVWVRSVADAFGLGVAVGNNGNIYLTGTFRNGSITFGNDVLTNNATSGGVFFVAKYDAQGNALWGKQAQCTQGVGAYDIAVDSLDNLYFSGKFGGTATFGSYSITANGVEDGFLCKYDSAGNPQWAQRHMIIRDMSVDAAGNMYLTKHNYISRLDSDGQPVWNKSPDMGTGGNAICATSAGDFYSAGLDPASENMLLGKYNSQGNLIWSLQVPPQNQAGDNAKRMVTDNAGTIYVAGTAQFGMFNSLISEADALTVDEDAAISSSFTVYPNPASDVVHVEYTAQAGDVVSHLKVSNALGQDIKTYPVNAQPGKQVLTIDLHGYPDGLYFISVNGQLHQRLILKR